MQHADGIAILAVRLAAVDRRALSQAWYSALHLARHDAPARGDVHHSHRADAAPHRLQTRNNDSRRHANAAVRAAGRASSRDAAQAASMAVERRAPKSELARRIERGLARGIPKRRSAAFDVRALDGRVHVVVRDDGRTTRIVAVCAPVLRERVERALAQARFALAARGVRTEAA